MFKKKLLNRLSLGLLMTLLLINISSNNTSAQQNIQPMMQTSESDSIVIEVSSKLPKELSDNIKTAIVKIYGEDQADQIYNNVLDIINDAKNKRSLKLHQEDLNRAADWYKDEIIYMFYTEHFGVNDKMDPNTFEGLLSMLDYLQDLGVTTIYMLPFMDSPMGDAGFDVRNPVNVRDELGGMEEFSKFVYEARKRGFKVKSDLILNHFSDQHKWFQQALNGDLDKLDYFVYSDKAPKYKKYRDEQKGVIVDYTEDDGSISSRRLIFPDIAENHYRKINIKDKDYYVYHTFYPFQPDINWRNPKVLYEVLEIMTFWANLGIDVFRVDAIPYFVKKKGSPSENLEETHEVVKLLSSFLQAIAPRSILLAEACQWPSDILPYFGQENLLPPKDILLYFGKEYKIKLNTNKEITRTDQVQVGYHFPYMPAIWASMLTENNKPFWNANKLTPKVPETSTWAIFLRVHDELTLEMVDLETRKIIYDDIIKKGQEFRKGLGVSGRMANFLEKEPERIALAYSILFSLPGIPIIYYGDEIGALNNFEYAKKASEEREKVQRAKDKNIEVISFYDSRDINRGPIKKSDFYGALKDCDKYKSTIYNTVKTMIKERKDNVALRRGKLQELESSNKSILSYARETDNQNILIINNLSSKESKTKIKLNENLLKSLTNKSKATDLLTNNDIKLTLKGNEMLLTLKPYECYWLNVK